MLFGPKGREDREWLMGPEAARMMEDFFRRRDLESRKTEKETFKLLDDSIRNFQKNPQS
jgi:hypothetical protein